MEWEARELSPTQPKYRYVDYNVNPFIVSIDSYIAFAASIQSERERANSTYAHSSHQTNEMNRPPDSEWLFMSRNENGCE